MGVYRCKWGYVVEETREPPENQRPWVGDDVGVSGVMWWRKPENLDKTTDLGWAMMLVYVGLCDGGNQRTWRKPPTLDWR